jgi:tetratricopeptide (TPR) repeat protein
MLSNSTTTVLFDSDVVRSALERMRQAEPPGDNPLRNLVWVRKQVESQGAQVSSSAVEFALNHVLADTIQNNVSHLRRIEGLSSPNDKTREAAYDALRGDFSHRNAELEAWSILYYRFVRVDLNLQIQDIARVLGANSRQVNRRLVHGCYRLTQELSRLEAEARAGSHRLWLRLKLPPATYATLFGMENRLPRLLELIGTNLPRTTALIGPGGIGKTTLVHAAARSLIDSEQLGDVVWLDLSTLTSYHALLAMLARGLGFLHLEAASLLEMETSVSERMAKTLTLIVIDNADLLDDPYHMLPRMDVLVNDGRVLITLREQPPNIPLHVLPVHPLPPNILTGLLQETARLRRIPGAKLLDSTRLKSIIDAVGGNPLAAKLVVSHLAFWPLERVLDELPALQTPSGSPLFDAIFRPAWDHLSDDEKLVFLALSLMPYEGVDWQTLHSFTHPDIAALDTALRNLTQSSLVEVSGHEVRYSLHTLTRRFAQDRARVSPWNESYRELLRRILTSDLATANGVYALSLIRQQIEMDEAAEVICEALQHVAPAVRHSGQWSEWREIQRHILDQLPLAASHRNWRATALSELGTAAARLGDRDEALDAFSQAVELWGESGDFISQAATLLDQGQLHEILGNTQPAYEAYQRAAAVGARLSDSDLRYRAINAVAGLALNNDRAEQALEIIQLALRSFEGEEPDGVLLSQLGAIYLRLGRVDEALVMQEHALVLLDQAGDLPRLARAYLRMGIACHIAGQTEQALQRLQSGLELMHIVGDAFGRARLMTSLGTVYADQNRWEEALHTWEDALSLQKRLNDQAGMALTLYNIADLHCQLGNTKAGYAYLDQSKMLAERLNLLRLLPKIRNHPLLVETKPPSLSGTPDSNESS